jgi:hypothetical protein
VALKAPIYQMSVSFGGVTFGAYIPFRSIMSAFRNKADIAQRAFTNSLLMMGPTGVGWL